VVIVSRKLLKQYPDSHADAKTPLQVWAKLIENCPAKNLVELKKTFPSVDYVRVNSVAVHIFNIGGNNHRLITEIDYTRQKLYVLMILTHAEHSKDLWKKKL
jgi:mRNA interferase HigB